MSLTVLRTVHAMQEEAWWPDDTSEWVFLPRAIGALGNAKHGSEWDGLEMAHKGVEIRIDDAFSLLDSLLSLPATHPLSERYKPHRCNPNDILRAWQSIRRAIDPIEIEDTNARANRLQGIWSFLKSELVAGRVVSGSRRMAGGAISQVAPEVWNSELLYLGGRFRSYVLDVEYPFGGKPKFSAGSPSYIFISKGSLDGLLRNGPGEVAPGRRAVRSDVARKYLQQRLQASPDKLMPGLKADWLILKALPGCEDISRETVDELRREVAPDLIRPRGRPGKSR